MLIEEVRAMRAKAVTIDNLRSMVSSQPNPETDAVSVLGK
jgi:hypothetical protein